MSRPRVERLALSDPDLYLQGVPYDYFRELRDHEPVASSSAASPSASAIRQRRARPVPGGRRRVLPGGVAAGDSSSLHWLMVPRS